MTKTEQEGLYLQAKEAYYSGDPIMSDDAFDQLEEELVSLGSPVIGIVGANAKGDKFKHLSKMGSLQKIQFKKDYQPIEEFQSFVSKIKDVAPVSVLEFTPKFDGNACNIIYKNGNLVKAISRGDGTQGQDLTEKIKCMNVPQKIDYMGIIEVRGEVVMRNSIFNEKYSQYKNPRNFVAGLLGRDDLRKEDLSNLTFMAFEMRSHLGDSFTYPEQSLNVLDACGFNTDEAVFRIRRTTEEVDIVEVFEHFTNYREIVDFLLDGFVCKAEEYTRLTLGETSHHPKWAMAIKFPPKSAITRVVDVEWNLGKTGYLTPVGILEPVDLDGSTVQRVTLHNYEWIHNMKVCPGALVEIVKSGDIIPAIVQVLEPSTEELMIPEYYGGQKVHVDTQGKNLYVENAQELDEFTANKLYKGVQIMDLQYIGSSMCARLVAAGVKSIFHVFNPTLMNEDYLSTNGDFKKGSRELERLLDEVKNFKEVDLWKVINSIQFDRLGKSLSKEAAKYIVGLKPDWSGYEKAVVEKITETDSKYRDLIHALCDKLERNGTTVVHPEENMNATGTYEMTGSPKEFGFKVKADFVNHMKEQGFEHGKLTKDTTYLITDSLESSSSKMAKARKLGVEIKLYSDFE